uniref:Uncharacterized protein n=1 Tax=Tanacetum cinerariifolium TaxID=118510 RepID=A0A6L2KL32_TANCI|nr:hypothetical protein [Tanacetum cinerariifolium]
MIEPFLITNNLMGYVDGSIPCPLKTLSVTDGATVLKENPNYPIWVSNDAHVRMAYEPHFTSREYTLKTQLLRIKMHSDETPGAYLNRLREEYNGLKTTITARQSPTAFSKIYALLSYHDYMLEKTHAAAPSVTLSFSVNYAVGSPSMPVARRAQLLELTAQLSAFGFQVSPIAPSGPQAFYGVRPSNNNRINNNNNRDNRNNSRGNNNNQGHGNGRQFDWASTQNTVYGTCNRCVIGYIPSQCPNCDPSTTCTRPSANFANTHAQSSNASVNWQSDTGANSHVTRDLEAIDNSEAYYGDEELYVGNGIIHRQSCCYTSEQNGFIERRNRQVVETGLTLLAQACLPQRFWHYAFDTVVYLISRMPSRTSTIKSPFEHIFKRSPDYSFLRVFGPSSPRSPILSPSSVSHLSPTSQNSIESSNGQPSPVSTTSIPTLPPPIPPPAPPITRQHPVNLHQNPKQRVPYNPSANHATVLSTTITEPTSFTVANNSPEWRQAMKEELKRDKNVVITRYKERFVAKDLGPLNYFLGIEIVPHVFGILLSQKKYILELLQSDGLSNCDPVSSPMVTSSSLSLDESAAFSNPRIIGPELNGFYVIFMVRFNMGCSYVVLLVLPFKLLLTCYGKVISILLLKLSKILNRLMIQMIDGAQGGFTIYLGSKLIS